MAGPGIPKHAREFAVLPVTDTSGERHCLVSQADRCISGRRLTSQHRNESFRIARVSTFGSVPDELPRAFHLDPQLAESMGENRIGAEQFPRVRVAPASEVRAPDFE